MASRRSVKPFWKTAAGRNFSAAGVRELARLIHRNPGTVSRWLRRPDWPFARTPPWNAVKVLIWANATLAPNPAAQSQLTESFQEGDAP